MNERNIGRQTDNTARMYRMNTPVSITKSDDAANNLGGGQNDIITLWRRDAENLKQIVPDFNLEEALKNNEFRKVLNQCGNVFTAYFKLNNATPSAFKRDKILQNAQSRNRGTGDSSFNPANLSDEDFKKYINKIKA